MATIMDVARLAGVSRTTVSRVLNNSPRVDKETLRKVRSAIQELNYEPSDMARNLRKQKTGLIAVLVPDISNPFFSGLLEGMENVALEAGYKIILCITGGNPEREMQYIRMIENKQVDGIILTALRNPVDFITPYLRYGPIVFANEYLDGDPIPSVAIDNTAAAQMVTQHLIDSGHRRIAFINGPEHIIICRDRKLGYLKALQDNGLAVDQHIIMDGEYKMDTAASCAQQLVTRSSRPTAILAANDTMAVGVVKALQCNGFQIPEDVAVAGFDNNPFSTVIEPNVTTVEQPIYTMGAETVHLLLTCFTTEIQKIEPRRRILETRLLVRRSSTR
ncbi:LacI family DNA-binding transcriptional regulator [Paenibacillus gansuensis]|uniref:LacI family DNA-binding transcriptional regulator n=1 Tax=Paenibacillus gansuensis TaxID=306542 RepID=A0ABW5PC65_9BACL